MLRSEALLDPNIWGFTGDPTQEPKKPHSS